MQKKEGFDIAKIVTYSNLDEVKSIFDIKRDAYIPVTIKTKTKYTFEKEKYK